MKGDELIDERAMTFPRIIAAKLAKGDHELEDLIEGECTLTLVEAARDFDPNHGGVPRNFHTHAYCKCHMRAKDLAFRTRRRRELIYENVRAAESVEPRESPSESSEVVRLALAKLDPIQKAIYRLSEVDGLASTEIGVRFGCHSATVLRKLKAIRERIRKTASRVGCKRGVGNLKPIPPPRSESQRKAAAEFCRKRAVANRLLGVIPHAKSLWYAARHEAKQLVGPEISLLALRRKLLHPDAGRRSPETSIGELKAAGWDAVRGPEALELSRQKDYRIVTPEATK